MHQKFNLTKTAMAVTMAAASISAFATEDNKPISEKEVTERIEVTGSRIKQMDLQGPSPIQVITAEEILKTRLFQYGRSININDC